MPGAVRSDEARAELIDHIDHTELEIRIGHERLRNMHPATRSQLQMALRLVELALHVDGMPSLVLDLPAVEELENHDGEGPRSNASAPR